MNEIISKIEDQLIGENGIALRIRLGEELFDNEVNELFANLDLLKNEIYADKLVPVSFMINIVDSISAINNSFDCDKDYEEKIMMFLDRFLEKLRNLNQ